MKEKDAVAVVAQRSHAEAGVEVFHWAYADEDKRRIHTYGFTNPDATSPVAAVMVSWSFFDYGSRPPRGQELRMDIDLVPRVKDVNRLDWLDEGDTFLVDEILPAHQLVEIHAEKFDAFHCPKRGYYKAELAQMSIEPSEHIIGLLWSSISTERNFLALPAMQTKGKKAMDYLAGQEILSKDPEIREAIVEAIAAQLIKLPKIETPALQSPRGRIR